jgi:tungstate transport system substrate-binding protein
MVIDLTARRLTALVCLAAGIALAGAPAMAQRAIVLASTTSTQNSGLFDDILPKFKQASGIDVRVIAQGTGQALRTAQNGDADALFVHDVEAELKFVAAGHGIERREVMYNDFVIVGPGADPAKVRGLKDAPAALQRISSGMAPFVSRGDDSGTHLAELRLWRVAGIDVKGVSTAWYRSTGTGMGAVLNTAAAMDAYALADRGTWLSFANRRSLALLVEGDPRLFNQYSVILVNPSRHPHVKASEARAFADWIVSPAGQTAIGDFTVAGQQAFFPNASKTTN